MLKKLCLFFLLCNIGLCLYAAQLTVLNTTDLHGRTTGKYGGIVQIASLIEEQRKNSPPDSILLIDCGDTIQGTFPSMIFQGKLMIKCLNYLKYDVWVVGNHEFDYSLKAIKERMLEFSGVSLAANLQEPYLAKAHSSWKMFTKAGIKVAVIGLTKSGMINTISFDAALKRVMPKVRAGKPDVIILAQHNGMYGKGFSIYKLMAKYPEIDLVLGGHSHAKKTGQKIGANIWYFQSVKHAKGLGKIIIDYDKKQGKIIKISSEIIPVNDKTGIDKKLLTLIKPDLELVEKLGKQKITKMIFKNTEKLDSSILEQRIIGDMMLKQTGADVAVCNTFPSNYKLTGTVNISFRRIYYWSRYNNTTCTLSLDKETYRKIMVEQKKWLKKKYRTVISYADKDLFKKKSKIVAAFNSYAISDAGGRFPFLRDVAKNKKYMLKNNNIIIRDALKKYLKRKVFTVSNIDGKISIKQKGGKKVSHF
jgi:2',3'-cyclic-nucleotide 2'-phosphodiesterase (5'-nucleotidase family)